MFYMKNSLIYENKINFPASIIMVAYWLWRFRTGVKTGFQPILPLIEYHYELPVVFHVLYQNEQQNIKKGRIQEIITACNKYYQNRLGSNSVDMNLEFVLATENPQGVKLDEPGVHPIQVSNPVQDCGGFYDRQS